MSAPEIVVGACYRDMADDEVVRVLRLDRDGVAVVRRIEHRSPVCLPERLEDLRFGPWERVPDPTPAVIEDLTVRDLQAWCKKHNGSLRVRITADSAEPDAFWHGNNDALTELSALMARVDGGK